MITKTPQDAEILSRLFDTIPGELSCELAEFLLNVQFGTGDKTRMHELSQKARDGELSEADQDEMDSYERVGHVLAILQAKARVRLKHATDSI